jgi:hypothetical protein
MNDKIKKLITLYGKITGETQRPSDRVPSIQVPVKKREIPKPYIRSGPK